MSIKLINEEYKLVFLDTNALSELISNNNFSDNLLKYLNGFNFEFCFSINSVLELKSGRKERYDSFFKMFSMNPCIVFKLYPDIIKYEAQKNKNDKIDYHEIAYSICPGIIKEYNFEYIINFMEKKYKLYDETIDNNTPTLKKMNDLKEKGSKYTKFDKEYELEMVKDTLKKWKMDINNIDLNDYPAIRMINMSYYDRIVNGKKEKLGKNDIHDIMISSVTPFVDIIITEAFQINIINKAKRIIPQIDKLECHKVSDFYNK